MLCACSFARCALYVLLLQSVHTSVPSYASSSTSLRVHECCPVLFSVPLLLYECYLYTSVIARLIAMVP